MKLIDPEYLEYTSTGLEYINPDYVVKEIEKMKRKMLNSNPFDYPLVLSGIDSRGNLRSFCVTECSASYESFGEPRYTFECISRDQMKYEYSEIVEPALKAQKRPFFLPERVIFNPPATIVYWSDGTKTVVKCKDEEFDEEKGLAMAISKKAFGNQGNYYNMFRRWLPKDEEVTLEYILNTSPQSINDIGKSIVETVNERLNQIKRGKQ